MHTNFTHITEHIAIESYKKRSITVCLVTFGFYHSWFLSQLVFDSRYDSSAQALLSFSLVSIMFRTTLCVSFQTSEFETIPSLRFSMVKALPVI